MNKRSGFILNDALLGVMITAVTVLVVQSAVHLEDNSQKRIEETFVQLEEGYVRAYQNMNGCTLLCLETEEMDPS